MAEPEELIIEGAHFITRHVHGVLRRRARAADDGATITVRDIRQRLEAFATALCGVPIPIRDADVAAPLSWLARLATRSPARRPARVGFPAADDRCVYLPQRLDGLEADAAIERYRLVTVTQAVRLMRGTSTWAFGAGSEEIRDRFLAAEAAVVDGWMARETPGLVSTLRTLKREALSDRPPMRTFTRREQAVESTVRAVLSCDGAYDGPVDAPASETLRWAVARTSRTHAPGRYRALPRVWYWGYPARPSMMQGRAQAAYAEPSESHTVRPRVAEMPRRPRIREAAPDEDDAEQGTWIFRADEPQESVEDPLGLQRPIDREQDADADALGDSLSELPEARVVRTPEKPREILRSGETARTPIAERPRPAAAGIAYPEWDYRRSDYIEAGAIVREHPPGPGDPAWIADALRRHNRLIRRVQAVFGRLRPRRIEIGRQADGPDVDVSACVSAAADLRAGGMIDDRLYTASRPERRRLAIGLLVDVSASTDAWISSNRRIVDVEKEALLVVCEALDALGDRYGVFAFSGEGPSDVSVLTVKRFSEALGPDVRERIAGLDADRYTRLGAAIRHAAAMVARERSDRAVLFVLSDGKPNDVDLYEGMYGVEDARQAVAETRAQGTHVFCLTVDREAPQYAGRIFGASGFAVLPRAERLLMVLVDVLRRHVGR